MTPATMIAISAITTIPLTTFIQLPFAKGIALNSRIATSNSQKSFRCPDRGCAESQPQRSNSKAAEYPAVGLVFQPLKPVALGPVYTTCTLSEF
jgi:hypothetical protein